MFSDPDEPISAARDWLIDRSFANGEDPNDALARWNNSRNRPVLRRASEFVRDRVAGSTDASLAVRPAFAA